MAGGLGCTLFAASWLVGLPWLAAAAGAFDLPRLTRFSDWLHLGLVVLGVLGWLFLAALGLALTALVWAELTWARRRNGRTWLGGTTRSNWRAFTENNLRPALPEGMDFVWIHGEVETQGPWKLLVGPPGWLFRHESAPILFTLRSGLVHAERLHGEMLPFKDRTQRDAALQQELRERLGAALERLEKRAAGAA